MIILQILAFLTLIPLTALMLLVFNLYLNHWLYLFFVASFGLGYSALWGLVFQSLSVVIVVYIALSLFYFLRMRSLRKPKYLRVKGDFRSKNHCLQFYIPLSCLNIFKWFPKKLNREISKDLHLEVDISCWVDQLIGHARGTVIVVQNEAIRLSLEIQ